VIQDKVNLIHWLAVKILWMIMH